MAAKNKTSETQAGVTDFLHSFVQNEKRRKDAFALVEFFGSVTGFEPKMWGPSIIGFGKYHYKYESGHEGEAPLAGFAPRKDSLVLYVATDFRNREVLLSKLGVHRSSKSCVYVKNLEDLDLEVLREIIVNSMDYVRKLYPVKKPQRL